MRCLIQVRKHLPNKAQPPGLIVNTTLYNNGRRFALTTLPSEAFRLLPRSHIIQNGLCPSLSPTWTIYRFVSFIRVKK